MDLVRTPSHSVQQYIKRDIYDLDDLSVVDFVYGFAHNEKGVHLHLKSADNFLPIPKCDMFYTFR